MNVLESENILPPNVSFEELITKSKNLLEKYNSELSECTSNSMLATTSKHIWESTVDIAFYKKQMAKSKENNASSSTDLDNFSISLKNICFPIVVREEVKTKKIQSLQFVAFFTVKCCGQIFHSDLVEIDHQTLEILAPMTKFHSVVLESKLKIYLMVSQVGSGGQVIDKKAMKSPSALTFTKLKKYLSTVENLCNKKDEFKSFLTLSAEIEKTNLSLSNHESSSTGSLNFGSIGTGTYRSSHLPSLHSFFSLFTDFSNIALTLMMCPNTVDPKIFCVSAKIKVNSLEGTISTNKDNNCVWLMIQNSCLFICNDPTDIHHAVQISKIPLNKSFLVKKPSSSLESCELMISNGDVKINVQFDSPEKALSYQNLLDKCIKCTQKCTYFVGSAICCVKKPSNICCSLKNDISTFYKEF